MLLLRLHSMKLIPSASCPLHIVSCYWSPIDSSRWLTQASFQLTLMRFTSGLHSVLTYVLTTNVATFPMPHNPPLFCHQNSSQVSQKIVDLCILRCQNICLIDGLTATPFLQTLGEGVEISPSFLSNSMGQNS